MNEPQPGFWLVRKVSRGPKVPARIWRPCCCTVGGSVEHAWRGTCDRFPPLVAEIDGERREDVLDVWHWGGEPIDESEFWKHSFMETA